MIRKIKILFTNSKVTFTFGIILGLILAAGGVYAATLASSKDVTYDNSNSSLKSTDVQSALDELYDKLPKTGVETIKKLYTAATKTSVTTAGGEAITQAKDIGLMQDSFGNIRYYGADPNNYVTFNGETAGWRIIGVFDTEDENGNKSKRIKLVRATSIGNYSWDNKTSNMGSSISDYGSNDWTDARLMMLLNPGYENGDSFYDLQGSLYWNRKSGTCYAGKNDGIKSCDFTSIGLTDTAKSQIDKVKYYLGGNGPSDAYADDYYNFERGNTVYTGRSTSWMGYIGLMYPSDYVYAADLSGCAQSGNNYDTDATNCTGTDWLFNSSYTWLISPISSHSYLVFVMGLSGYVDNFQAFSGSYEVFPVLYLKSSTQIVNGTGTKTDPYVIN